MKIIWQEIANFPPCPRGDTYIFYPYETAKIWEPADIPIGVTHYSILEQNPRECQKSWELCSTFETVCLTESAAESPGWKEIKKRLGVKNVSQTK